MRAERARVDQLVQMERGQLTGDPRGGSRFIPGYRSPDGTDELIHPPPQIVIERGDSPYCRIGCHTFMITPATAIHGSSDAL